MDTTDNRVGAPVTARPPILLLAAAALVFAIGLYFALVYAGLISRMGEWQFANLGWYHPMLTVLSFVALLTLIWRLVKRGAGAARTRDDDAVEPHGFYDRPIVRRLLNARTVLFAVSALSGLTALGGFVHWLQLPGDSGPAATIAASSTGAFVEGPVRLTGMTGAGPVSRYREGLWKSGRSQYFVPVRQRPATAGGKGFDLFVELEPPAREVRGTMPALSLPADARGVLRRNALPRELAAMYRGAGYAVDDRAAVLFRNGASSSRATVFFMGEAIAVGLISLLCALFIGRRPEVKID